MKIFSIDKKSDKIQNIISFLGLKFKILSKKKVKNQIAELKSQLSDAIKKYEDKNNFCLELKEKNQRLAKEKEEISSLNLDNEKKKKNWRKKYERSCKKFISYIKASLVKYNYNTFVYWLSTFEDKTVIFENENEEMWRSYIVALLYLGKQQQAADELKQYIDKFGTSDLKWILSIANLAVNLGYSDNELKKSSLVYRAFKENEKNNTLKSLLEGKSIAVVGNSPCQLGKGLGSEIDNHDVVIRMNNYETKGYEQDYGKKTTIYARGKADDVKMRDCSEYDAVMISLDLPNFEISHTSNIIDFCYDFYMAKNNIISMPTEVEKELADISTFWATMGCRTIWMIYKTLGNLDNVDFYGFNFLKENPDDYSTHYFNDRDEDYAKRTSRGHNFSDEAVFMKDFIRKVKGL